MKREFIYSNLFENRKPAFLMCIIKRQFPPCFGIHAFSDTVLRQKIGDLHLRLLTNLLTV